MTNWLHKIKFHFSDKDFAISVIYGVGLLILSLIVNYYAGIYATQNASNAVTDLVLSNIRVYDVDSLFIYGPIVFWVFVILICVAKPQRIPFALKSITLFVLIRALFVSLTHIGPFPTQLLVSDPSKITQSLMFGGDLFFSGHTGLPFLMALMFWEQKFLRILFIIASVFFGVVVLAGHIHYSIDVLSAFFITYTIYHLATLLFKKDHTWFLQ